MHIRLVPTHMSEKVGQTMYSLVAPLMTHQPIVLPQYQHVYVAHNYYTYVSTVLNISLCPFVTAWRPGEVCVLGMDIWVAACI